MFYYKEDNTNNTIQNETEYAIDTEFSMDDISKKHVDILERIARMCRSNKEIFTVTDRLEAIRSELTNTEYLETFDNRLFSMWSKKTIEELDRNCILISTHMDTVPGIRECYSNINENGLLHGTYDNLGTNAAAVCLMIDEQLPDNIVFAFTGDEETGGCTGARQAANYLLSRGKFPICIALDVTYEGFSQNKLMSIENLTPGKKGQDFMDKIAKTALSTEPDGVATFCFVKASINDIPTQFRTKQKAYMQPSTGMYDEAFAYRDEGFPAMSICLPSSGSMHSDSGLKVKQPIFEGYIISLASFLYQLTKTHESLMEAYKTVKESLIAKAINITVPKEKYQAYWSQPVTYIPNTEEEDLLLPWNRVYNSDEEGYDDELNNSMDYTMSDWYIPDFDEWIPSLLEEALNYYADDEDYFIERTEVPKKYLDLFDGGSGWYYTPEEKEEYIEDFFAWSFPHGS